MKLYRALSIWLSLAGAGLAASPVLAASERAILDKAVRAIRQYKLLTASELNCSGLMVVQAGADVARVTVRERHGGGSALGRSARPSRALATRTRHLAASNIEIDLKSGAIRTDDNSDLEMRPIIPGAQAQRRPGTDCDLLWSQRNLIFKNAGYCFRTADAIRRFGNAGCQYDDINDVRLSSRDRQTVAEIQAMERQFGCRR